MMQALATNPRLAEQVQEASRTLAGSPHVQERMQEAFEVFSANPRFAEQVEEASRALAANPDIQVRMQEMLRSFTADPTLVEQVRDASRTLAGKSQVRVKVQRSVRAVATNEEFQESLHRTISTTPAPVLSNLRDDFELFAASAFDEDDEAIALPEDDLELAAAFDRFAASEEGRQAAGLLVGVDNDTDESKVSLRRGEARRVAVVYAIATYLVVAAALHGTNVATVDDAVFDPYKLVDDQLKAIGFALAVLGLIIGLRKSDR
ncbi:hypothetical protein [Micromonospora sp. NPDC005220]|uniref:hypothetical protein n=1 Tax=Micromonospora sp. NPDC005220 TaxID=3155589 RepID=UPI0033AB82C6